jgi:hypothetical protein
MTAMMDEGVGRVREEGRQSEAAREGLTAEQQSLRQLRLPAGHADAERSAQARAVAVLVVYGLQTHRHVYVQQAWRERHKATHFTGGSSQERPTYHRMSAATVRPRHPYYRLLQDK